MNDRGRPASAEQAVLDGYLDAYTRRQRGRDGAVFGTPEADGLVALLLVRLARSLRDEGELSSALEALDAVSRSILEHGVAHEPAVDIAGLAWAEAYGVLPLTRPPIEQLDWVVERGAAAGAVAGVLPAAWRLLFLSTAIPLLTWRNRSRAEAGRERWLRYVVDRLRVRAATTVGSGSVSAELRLARVVAEACQAARDPGLTEVADAFAASVLSRVSWSALPTAQACHVAVLERRLTGDRGSPVTIESIVRDRLPPDGTVLSFEGGRSDRPEMSPWVPLTLVAHGVTPFRAVRLRTWRRIPVSAQ